jgi:hypothetical protein
MPRVVANFVLHLSLSPSDAIQALAEALIAMDFEVTTGDGTLKVHQGSVEDMLCFGGLYINAARLPKHGEFRVVEKSASQTEISGVLSDGVGHSWIERQLRRRYQLAFQTLEDNLRARLAPDAQGSAAPGSA